MNPISDVPLIEAPDCHLDSPVKEGDSDSCRAPLFVDLDGTLIATDLLYEGIAAIAARRPLELLKLPYWISQGRAQFKQKVASEGGADADYLPYRSQVVDFLTEQRKAGVSLVLATASPQELAESVSEHLQLFDAVLASDGERNLKAEQKCEAIQSYCRERGFSKFAYLGDSRADLEVWKHASKCYIVGSASPSLIRQLRTMNAETEVIGSRSQTIGAVWRVLRPHQWIKNILLFVPIIVSIPQNWSLVYLGFAAFVAFSLCASSVYVFNDMIDLRADRRHRRKRRRPFASGELPLEYGPVLGLCAFLSGFAVALLFLNQIFLLLLMVYFASTTLYSIWWKRKMLVDVFVLSGLYTIRLFAGGVAVGIPVSEWLLTFSVFLFSSLAFLKRYAELLHHFTSKVTHQERRRGYLPGDLTLVESMGVTSGYLSVLVLALYIHSPEIRPLYSRSWPMWIVCGILLYWISRMWMKARRGSLTDDPIVFAVKDRISLIAGGVVGVLLMIAKL